jgi:heme-degrading monooxygenase HmoA
MQMRVVWGKILPGQWDSFETDFKKAMAARGTIDGLKAQWLARDQNDPDAGYSISLWESGEAMRKFWDSPKRKEEAAGLERFFVNQFTVTNCDVKWASTGH